MESWPVQVKKAFAFLIATALGAICCLALAQNPKGAEERATRMRKLAIEWSACSNMLEGPPGRIPLEQRLEIGRKQFDLLLEGAKLFRDGPCPDAVAELIILGEQPGHEWLWLFQAQLAYIAPIPYYESYLSLLEGKDEHLNKRLGHALEKARKEFRITFEHPHIGAFEDFLKRYVRAGEMIPLWFIDGAYRDTRDADKAMEFFWRYDEQAKKELDWADIEWARHIVALYRWRVLHSETFRRERVAPEDLAKARRQLEWLWNTGRWWARRYVIEMLGEHPELAFQGATNQVKVEGHPYIVRRVKELDEGGFLQRLEFYEKQQK